MSDKDEEITVKILSNDPEGGQGINMKLMLMETIYGSIINGQLCYMDGKDAVTGDIVPLLVGIDPIDDTRFRVFPIARLLTKADDLSNYLVPDGAGDYYARANGIDPVDSLGLSSEEEGRETKGLDKEITIH